MLDGAWGTMIPGGGLTEEDYRGERFASHPLDVAGDPDVLNLTRPDVVRSIHERYLAAGADITTTNTFTATSIGQADYGLEDAVYEMNVAGARIAREAAGDRGSSPARSGRSTSRSRSARASTTRASARTPSTRSRSRTPSRSAGSSRAASTCCCSRRSSTR